MKRDRGCVNDSPIPGRWEVAGERYSKCPLKLITQTSYDLMQAYWLFKEKFLPNGIGWLGESSKFLQAMQVIERIVKSKEVKDARQ